MCINIFGCRETKNNSKKKAFLRTGLGGGPPEAQWRNGLRLAYLYVSPSSNKPVMDFSPIHSQRTVDVHQSASYMSAHSFSTAPSCSSLYFISHYPAEYVCKFFKFLIVQRIELNSLLKETHLKLTQHCKPTILQ